MNKYLALIVLIMILLSSKCEKEPPPCFDANKINSNPGCSTYCTLVCGCDGKEYCNGCEAEARGNIYYTDGPC